MFPNPAYVFSMSLSPCDVLGIISSGRTSHLLILSLVVSNQLTDLLSFYLLVFSVLGHFC